MNRLRRLSYIFLAALTALTMLSACEDDFPQVDEIGEGSAVVRCTIDFDDMFPAELDSRAPGNAVGKVTTLSILAYNSDGDLMVFHPDVPFTTGKYTETPGYDQSQYDPEEDTPSWESDTRTRLTVDLPASIDYGRYRIYALANKSVTREEVANEDDLLNMEVSWDPIVANNNAMLGYFTLASEAANDSPLSSHKGKLITIRDVSVELHAWLKRTVSKLTVAFDTSQLHNNIWIYIKSIQIKDIPARCKLGADNTPDDVTKDIIKDGEKLYFKPSEAFEGSSGELQAEDNGTDYHKWLKLANNDRLPVGSSHANSEPAFYFFENMQGNYADTKEHYKVQERDSVYHNIDHPGLVDTKDGLDCGTYVEIEGYYHSKNPNDFSSEKIIYRFMLGKDVTYDFNAQRNHHYKLTLGFKGYANTPDWHIEYVEEDPSLSVPDYMWVPYLYNQQSIMPIRLTGNPTKVTMEVIENDWAPYVEVDNKLTLANASYGSSTAKTLNNFYWNKDAWNSLKALYSGQVLQSLGFVSVYPNLDTDEHLDRNIGMEYSFQGQDNAVQNLYKKYYNRSHTGDEGSTQYPHTRTFGAKTLAKLNQAVNEGNAVFSISSNDGGRTRTLYAPVYTRAKSMIMDSNFSGNNPYDYFVRKAKIRVTAEFTKKNGQVVTKSSDVDIFQGRRITNPKGVWRHNNTADFHVKLACGAGPTGNANYRQLVSRGSWKAYVENKGAKGKSFGLKVTDPNISYIKDDTIFGYTDTPVDFKITFAGVKDFGMVVVKYHADLCTHNIFLRYGSGDVTLGGVTWTESNVYKVKKDANDRWQAELCASPLSGGTLYKRGNFAEGILEYNQTKKADQNSAYDIFNDPSNWNLNLANGTTRNTDGYFADGTKKIWSSINGAASFPNVWLNGQVYRVATYQDFATWESQSGLDQGYGIVYGNEATETLMNYSEAGTFYDLNQDGISDNANQKGMRGCIVYDPVTYHQVFFPIGSKGMGRRMRKTSFSAAGELRYSDVDFRLGSTGNNLYRPVAMNMPPTPGALYWLRESHTYYGWCYELTEVTVNGVKKYKGKDGKYYNRGERYWWELSSAAWDMNYFALAFLDFPEGNCMSSTTDTDACYVRLVKGANP